MELQPLQGSFYSSWLVTEDGKVITAKFDVESKHSLVESSGLNVVGIVKGRVNQIISTNDSEGGQKLLISSDSGEISIFGKG